MTTTITFVVFLATVLGGFGSWVYLLERYGAEANRLSREDESVSFFKRLLLQFALRECHESLQNRLNSIGTAFAMCELVGFKPGGKEEVQAKYDETLVQIRRVQKLLIPRRVQ